MPKRAVRSAEALIGGQQASSSVQQDAARRIEQRAAHGSGGTEQEGRHAPTTSGPRDHQ